MNKGLKFNKLLPKAIREQAGKERDQLQTTYLDLIESFVNLIEQVKDHDAIQFQKVLSQKMDDVTDYHNILINIGYKVKDKQKLKRIIQLLYRFLSIKERLYVPYELQKRFLEVIFHMFANKIRLLGKIDIESLPVEPIIDIYMDWVRDYSHGPNWLIARKLTDTQSKLGKRYKLLYRQAIQLISPYYSIEGTQENYLERLQKKFSWMINLAGGDKDIARIQVLFLNCINPAELKKGDLDAVIKQWKNQRSGFGKLHSILLKPTVKDTPSSKKKPNLLQEWDHVHWRFLFNIARQVNTIPELSEASNEFLLTNIIELQQLDAPSIAMQGKSVAHTHAQPSIQLISHIGTFLGQFEPLFLHRLLNVFSAFSLSEKDNGLQFYCLSTILKVMANRKKYAALNKDSDFKASQPLNPELMSQLIASIIEIIEKQYQSTNMGKIFSIQSVLNHLLYIDSSKVLGLMMPKLMPLLQKFVFEQAKPTELMMGIGIAATLLSHSDTSGIDLSMIIGSKHIAMLIQNINLNNSILSGILIRFLSSYLLHIDALNDEVIIDSCVEMLLTVLGTAGGDDHVSSMNTDNISFEEDKENPESAISNIQEQLLNGLNNFTKVFLSKIVDESIFKHLIEEKLVDFIKKEYKPIAVKAISPFLREAAAYNEQSYQSISKVLLEEISRSLRNDSNRTSYFLNLYGAVQSSNPHVTIEVLDKLMPVLEEIMKKDVKENEGMYSKLGSVISNTLTSLQEILPYHAHDQYDSKFVSYDEMNIRWKVPQQDVVKRIAVFYSMIAQQIMNLAVEKGTINLMKGLLNGVRFLSESNIKENWIDNYPKLDNVMAPSIPLSPSLDDIQQFYCQQTNEELQESIVELFNTIVSPKEKIQDIRSDIHFIKNFHLDTLCPLGKYLPFVHMLHVHINMKTRYFINRLHVDRQPTLYTEKIVDYIYALTFSDLSIQSKAVSTMNHFVDNYNDEFAAFVTRKLLGSLDELNEASSDQTICRLIAYLSSKESFLLEIVAAPTLSKTLFSIIFNTLIHDKKSMIQMKVNDLVNAFVTNWHHHFEGNRIHAIATDIENILNTLLTYRKEKEMPMKYESHASRIIGLYLKAYTLNETQNDNNTVYKNYFNQKLIHLMSIPTIWKEEIFSLLCVSTRICPSLHHVVKIEKANELTIKKSCITYVPIEGQHPDIRTITYSIQSNNRFESLLSPSFLEQLLATILEGYEKKHGLKQFVRISTLVGCFYRAYPDPQYFLNYLNDVIDTKLLVDNSNEEEENKILFHIGTLLSGIHFGLCGSTDSTLIATTTSTILSSILLKILSGNYENASQILRFIVVSLSRLRGPTDWLIQTLHQLSKQTKSNSVFQRTRSLLFLSYPFQIHRHSQPSWYQTIGYPSDFDETSSFHLDRSLQSMFHAMYFGIHRVGNHNELEAFYDNLLAKGLANPLEFDNLLSFICFLSDASLITTNSFIQSLIFEPSRLKALVQQLFYFLKDVSEESKQSNEMNLNDLTYYTMMTLSRLFAEGDCLPKDLLNSTVTTLLDLIHYERSPLSSSRERMKIVIFLGSVLFNHASTTIIDEMIDRLYKEYLPVEKSLMVLEHLSDLLTLCLSLVPTKRVEAFANLALPRIAKLKSPKVYLLYILRSLIQTFPSTLPPFVSRSLVLLATYESKTKYHSIVTQTFAKFWKNHQSLWSIHSASLSPEDRDTIEQITAGHSYYA